ncbi:sugar transferase [Galbibacter mesophilus]|uniref:sugar transferase n=1 Tax=Galbibacter mesophilus TaxID=379069 RepID=UPI00191F6279|nr:sugar transferase [Galbibacter mesophilus]MCM5663429.1 sugar transferase [Galbibacter mesophilus]
MYLHFFKRLLDVFIASLGLLILLPLFIGIWLALLFINEGNPFFFQHRPGKNESIFRLIKFKSMTDKKDSNGNLLPDKDRITPFGQFIRKYSLDEIPQLLNVLKGDMSLVGPRPLLIRYLPLYNDFQKKRHAVKPGITGWAQVNGRNGISWDQKFHYDVFYVENLSFFLDIKILFLTFFKVLKTEGINQKTGVPMVPFTGQN